MPRRLILSATERDTLLALPESQDDLIRYYTFNDSDLSLIRQRRGDANRLGFAVQLSLLRYPGYLRPVRTVQHPRGECRRARFHLCARRLAVPRVRSTD
ncbi:DUF4158 domain-containing protein [Pseudomonas sp. 7-41]|uniref:DUF4158 domain-containing protein n=1 Tax=Pseudomonas sp. 7-41 TaxID=2898483 RepID=UPI003FA74ADA